MTVVGYARVSREDQQLELQRQALKAAGCERLFSEKLSGAQAERPALGELLGYVREGDTVVVWKLDRLGRSLRHLLEVLEQLRSRGVAFRSLQEGMDTETAAGRMLFQVLGAIAEFEREMIRERTRAGMAVAKRRGHRSGRPPKLQGERLEMAQRLYDSREYTMGQVARMMGVGISTLYRTLRVEQARFDAEAVSRAAEAATARPARSEPGAG